MNDSLYAEMWETEMNHWWFVGRRKIVTSLIERCAPRAVKPWRICELGCGTGGNLAAFSEEHDVVGVDASPRALEFASRRLGSRVRAGRLPAQLPVEPESFDVVLSTDVFEHIEDDAASADAALNLLRPGGILVATVPAYQWLFSPRDRHHHHFRRYGRKQFAELFNVPGANIELLSHYNALLFPPAAAVRLWSKWRPVSAANGDVRVPSSFINRTLQAVFSSERHLLGRASIPFGLSLIAVVRRDAAGVRRRAA